MILAGCTVIKGKDDPRQEICTFDKITLECVAASLITDITLIIRGGCFEVIEGILWGINPQVVFGLGP
jgi:hypothetical protein